MKRKQSTRSSSVLKIGASGVKSRRVRACRTVIPYWQNEDIWTVIMSFLDGPDLMRLSLVNRYFRCITKDESLWKELCIRHMNLAPDLKIPSEFSWKRLYTAAFDGSHAYMRQELDKHIDWMRVGAFYCSSNELLGTERLQEPSLFSDMKNDELSSSICHIPDVKSGIWIADLHLVSCPVCEQPSCEGTMQTLDARHWELLSETGYLDGTWEYEEVKQYRVSSQSRAAGALLDASKVNEKSSKDLLACKSWCAPAGDWQPRGIASLYGAAASTNLQTNEGLQIKIFVMKAGTDGPVVGIRMSQQLT